MKEIEGDLWAWMHKGAYIFITTNGDVKKNGLAVMGRGCALEALNRFPGIARELGRLMQIHGNRPYRIIMPPNELYTFPVKHHWDEKASIPLIGQSVDFLNSLAESRPDDLFILPRPGCGNGGLRWSDVKKFLMRLPDNVLVIHRAGEL